MPYNRIVRKELPEKDRQVYWKHTETEVKSADVPFQNVPLNPDAFFTLMDPSEKSKKEYD